MNSETKGGDHAEGCRMRRWAEIFLDDIGRFLEEYGAWRGEEIVATLFAKPFELAARDEGYRMNALLRRSRCL